MPGGVGPESCGNEARPRDLPRSAQPGGGGRTGLGRGLVVSVESCRLSCCRITRHRTPKNAVTGVQANPSDLLERSAYAEFF